MQSHKAEPKTSDSGLTGTDYVPESLPFILRGNANERAVINQEGAGSSGRHFSGFRRF